MSDMGMHHHNFEYYVAAGIEYDPAHDHGTRHHHHGPGDNNILIHDHDDPADHNHYIETIDDQHNVIRHILDHYGPADHDHDTPDIASDGQRHDTVPDSWSLANDSWGLSHMANNVRTDR